MLLVAVAFPVLVLVTDVVLLFPNGSSLCCISLLDQAPNDVGSWLTPLTTLHLSLFLFGQEVWAVCNHST